MEKLHPKTREELKELIDREISVQGIYANLNVIDTSSVEDMSGLFEDLRFNGNISDWDVSRVTNMERMFMGSTFFGDISRWDPCSSTPLSRRAFQDGT